MHQTGGAGCGGVIARETIRNREIPAWKRTNVGTESLEVRKYSIYTEDDGIGKILYTMDGRR